MHTRETINSETHARDPQDQQEISRTKHPFRNSLGELMKQMTLLKHETER